MDGMGWMDPQKWADSRKIDTFLEYAAQVREKADVFVLIGVGGSNQAARAVIEALRPEGGPRILYAGNNLSAIEMNRILHEIEGKSVYLNVIAKNFETLEPGAAFRILRAELKKRYGDAYRERIFATGTAGSSLEALCREKGYRFLEFPEDVGGRYSALTSVGLFPMAAAGVNIRELVRGALDLVFQMVDSAVCGKRGQGGAGNLSGFLPVHRRFAFYGAVCAGGDAHNF